MFVTVGGGIMSSGQLSLFCHYKPSKMGEKEGNQVKLKVAASSWPARGLGEFVWLARMT
jgi:hypothetical protein